MSDRPTKGSANIFNRKRGWVPNEDECKRIVHSEIKDLKARTFLMGHSMRVKNYAIDIACDALDKGWPIDMDVMIAGAWLHDVGKRRGQKIAEHGYVGRKLLEDNYRISAGVLHIVESHVAMPKRWVRRLDLDIPIADYLPQTREARIVCFSDKYIGQESVREYNSSRRKYFSKNYGNFYEDFHKDFSRRLAKRIGKYTNVKYKKRM